MKGQQLPLAVQLRESATFSSYHAGANADAVAALHSGSVNVYVYGSSGSGKTHLLQACARERDCVYLPLDAVAAYGAEALGGYESSRGVCLDGLEALAPSREGCIALLRLLDALRARGAWCAVAAGAPPDHLGLALPDLRTRLSAFAVYGLQALDDTQRATLLRDRALARGLELPDEVSRWLLNHLPRDSGSLIEALERLDRATLTAKRRLTLPFAQSVLAHADARTAAG